MVLGSLLPLQRFLPLTLSVSPNVGSEQWELDLKGPPHFYLQVKGIILQVYKRVCSSLSPDTCSTARVTMMFEVPSSAIHALSSC